MKTKVLGLVILLLMIGGGMAYKFFYGAGLLKTTMLKGFVGSEKIAFLENPRVKEILRKKYGVQVNAIKAGSLEMVQQPPAADIDFLWPSSQVALELFKTKNQRMVKSEILFNSPIVLYSWELVTNALQAQGIVEQDGNTLYVKDMKALLEAINVGKTWTEIGLKELFGKIAITTTDPVKSNTGNTFAGLAANILHGDVVDATSIQMVLPNLKTMFARLGYMPASSQDLFQQYLTKGIGDKPIIVGYESQVVEFSLQNQQLWPKVKHKIRILYPKPTVWSSHPLMILQERANPLLQAMQDAQIQKIAWEQHGFRTGLVGVQNDPKVLDVAGIPENITYVMPMPGPSVMEAIMLALQN